MGSRSGTADPPMVKDKDMAGRSTSVTSSSYRRRRGDTRSKSRSRSRSPKRQRYDRLSGDTRQHRERDRDRSYRDGSYRGGDDSQDRRGRDRDTRREYDDRDRYDKNLKKKEEDSSRRHHPHGSSHDHDRHRRHYHHHHEKDKEKDQRQREKKHQHHDHHEPGSNSVPSKPLPFGSRILSRKTDQVAFKPLFSYYLDLHKNLDISQLPPDEVRGRWKSFVNKWNSGQLAEGWYDPALFERVSGEWSDAGAAAGDGGQIGGRTGDEGEEERTEDTVMGMGDTETDEFGRTRARRSEPGRSEEEDGQREKHTDPESNSGTGSNTEDKGDNEEDEDEDDYGPALPPTRRGGESRQAQQRHGAEPPTLEDLTLRAESLLEDRHSQIESLRLARKEDKKLQKERLEEILPRPEAGTRERKLEKKKLVNEKMKGFRERSPGAAEVAEEDLMGGGEGGPGSLEEQKRRLRIQEAKVSERQLRREAIERAKAAEREERIREFREREEKAVERLRELARRRFGGGTGAEAGTGTG